CLAAVLDKKLGQTAALRSCDLRGRETGFFPPTWKPALMTRDALFAPFEAIEGDRTKGLVLLADHAGRALPDEYGDLGLPAAEFDRHIAYDIGVENVTRRLAARLGVPAVMARFSRLLIDPNRGEDDPTLI